MKITLRPENERDNANDVVLADGADRADDNVRGPASASISVSIGLAAAVCGGRSTRHRPSEAAVAAQAARPNFTVIFCPGRSQPQIGTGTSR